ncbi:MAG: photosynthetic reaction center subunit H [Pseudomonadota bacterium]
MEFGNVTEYFDLPQLLLYLFWLFFFSLIVYLHNESKREGYPLVDSHNPNYKGGTLFGFPKPKVFKLPHGQGERVAPKADPQYELNAEQLVPGPGFPLEPKGNPMLDGIGPAAYAIRPETPDLTHDTGTPRIIPMRVASDWSVESRDPDPRGNTVYGADGEPGGTVTDLWIDLSEPHIRYLEIEPLGAASSDDSDGAPARKRVLMPMTFARVKKTGEVIAKSVCGRHFADAPGTANPDFVTLQEEDKIGAYYGGGHLYALPERKEPML